MLVLFLGFSLYSQAPSTETKPVSKLNVTVKGQVLDSLTNEVLSFATLRIATSENPDKPVKMLSADEVGKFQVVLENAGKYILSIHYVGKNPTPTPFEITASDKQVDLDKIYASDINTLEEVVVSAVKPLVKVDLDKITYSTEDDPDSKTSTVLDMMRKVPMITVDGEDNIQLKGSSSFKIYMDGKPSNLISNNPSQVLKSMPANMVKSVEVITDPGAKYDAEGVSGIINIITNKQPMGGYTATASAGVNSLGGFNVGLNGSAKYGKLGFTGGYNYSQHKNPESDSYSYTEYYTDDAKRYLNQNGTSKYSGNFQYGSGELSYEIDTLNLISAAFSRYGGGGTTKNNMDVVAQDINKQNIYSYLQAGQSESSWGETQANVDYQRTFNKKDELLTASYRFSTSPNDSESDTKIEENVNFPESWRKQFSDASDVEHTFQLDYTTPLAKIHTIEGGAKYIIRLNESNSEHNIYNPNDNEWTRIQSNNDEFKYRYDIFCAYLGYNLRYNNYGFKTGLRLENTKIDAEYPLNENQNFGNKYFTLVPSATFTYRFKMVHNLRLGYNMRVQRPGIWNLNPYINTTDPQYIFQGNPNLDVEKAHNIGLNYSFFKAKISMNASINYRFVNNSIQRITYLKEFEGREVNYTTYENTGKQNRTRLDTWVSWSPTQKWKFNLNASGSYVDIRGNNNLGMPISNSGFMGDLFAYVQYTLPKDFRVSLNCGGSTPWVDLQGKSSGFQFNSISLNKDFLNKKLTVSINCSSLFEKYRSYSRETVTNEFYTKNENKYTARNFGIRVSYRFGEMKQQIQKARRGISNDDKSSGGNSQGGGGGNSGGGGS